MFYVYLYIDPVTFKPMYVGKGCRYSDGRDRSHVHLKRKDKHPFVQRVQKLIREGTPPIITHIECSTEQAAYELEIGLIRLIGRGEKGPLLNLTDGGDAPPSHRGKVMSAHQRANISAAQRAKGEEHWTKRPDVRAKMSASRKGVPVAGRCPIVMCPHCDTVGSLRLMARYHFEKCRVLNT